MFCLDTEDAVAEQHNCDSSMLTLLRSCATCLSIVAFWVVLFSLSLSLFFSSFFCLLLKAVIGSKLSLLSCYAQERVQPDYIPQKTSANVVRGQPHETNGIAIILWGAGGGVEGGGGRGGGKRGLH